MNEKSYNILGMNFKFVGVDTPKLPVYLTTGRKFKKMHLRGCDFILVTILNEERFNVSALEKQLEKLSEKYEMPVAFEFSNVTRTQVESLISHNIPFVSGENIVYLPFLGVSIRDVLKKAKKINAKKMMPITQALFLFILYNPCETFVMKKDAADYLGVTRTSITRASEQLCSMGIINEKKHGKECYMFSNYKGVELYHLAKDYLINPIQSTLYIESNDAFQSCTISGESALSEKTMLNRPNVDTYAVYKSNCNLKSIKEIDVQWHPEAKVMRLEKWKYDPMLFSKNGFVDPVSLAMTLENSADERIDMAVEEYMEKWEW